MTQLHQVLLNLVVNARDAMPQGGRLTLEARNEALDESYAAMHPEARTGLYVVFSVNDSGTGIPPEIIDKIFDPFFTTKEAGRGTGLGLSTAYAIVKGHGGFINVYSEVGKGTDIRVYFPAQKAGQRVEAGAPPRDLPRGRGEHVLIVDDEDSISSVVVRTLERHGYRATAVRNGAEALAVFVQRQPAVDVVLTDMAMPVMDGPAMIVALRTLDPCVRIVAASGLGSNGKFVHVVNAGVQHFLQKPFTAEALLRTMRAILDSPAKPKE
jgi:CheY-like chemotaxis protein